MDRKLLNAPQQSDGSEVLIGKQQRISAGEPGWDRDFVADKQGGVDFLQADNGHLPEWIQNATAYIDPAKVNKWPFFIVPKLDTTEFGISRYSTNAHAHVTGYGHHLLDLGKIHDLIIYNGIPKWPSSKELTCFPHGEGVAQLPT